MMYRKFRYHWQRTVTKPFLFFWTRTVVKTGTSSQFFRDRKCLHAMLNRWSGTGTWKFWEDHDDAVENIKACPEPLPYLAVGFHGEFDHEHTFNGERPRYMQAA